MQDAKPDLCCQSLVLHPKHAFGIRQQDILQDVLKKSPPTRYHDKCKRIRQKRKWKTWVLPTPYRYNFTLASPESVALFLLLIYLDSDTGPWEGSTGSVFVCERDSFGFCHQQWSKSNLGTSESNHSISPVVFIHRERERPEDGGKDGGKLWKRDSERMEGGGGWQSIVIPNFFLISPPSFILPLFPLPPTLPVGGFLLLGLASAGK